MSATPTTPPAAPHTGGEWRASPYSSVLGCVVSAQPDPTKNGIRICGVGGPVDRAEVEANARLIAAAPDLLEALERARQFIDITRKGYEEVEIDGEMVDPYEFMGEIDAALERARG